MFIIQDMLQTQIIDKYKYISKIMVNNYNYDIKNCMHNNYVYDICLKNITQLRYLLYRCYTHTITKRPESV